MKAGDLACTRLFTFLVLFFVIAVSSANSTIKNQKLKYGSINVKPTSSSVELSWRIKNSRFKLSYYNQEGAKLGEKVINTNQVKIDNLDPDNHYTFIIETDVETFFAFASTTKGIQPSRIGAIAHDKSATVIWEAIPDAISYDLYISLIENGHYQKVGEFATPSADVYNLLNKATYFFKVQANFKEKTSNNLNENSNEVAGFPVLPAYELSEITAVTPGDKLDPYVNHFRAYKKGSNVYFNWSAVADAKSYNIKYSKVKGKEIVLTNTPVNNYTMKYPNVTSHYRVIGVYGWGYASFEGFASRIIELGSIKTPEWEITGGIDTITVHLSNYNEYDKAKLYCIGEGRSDWFYTEMDNNKVTAAGLPEGNYTCKLKVTLNNLESESDTKNVYVLSTPEAGELLNVYVWDNNAELRWKSSVGESYNIYLQENDGEIKRIAENIKAHTGETTAYEINNLKCKITYKAYVEKINEKEDNRVTGSDDFKLDLYYCGDNKQKNVFRKLKPTGDIPPDDGRMCLYEHRAITYKNKIYVVSPCGIYTFDPSSGTEGLWTKISSEPITRKPTIGIHNDKLYVIGGGTKSDSISNNIYVLDLLSPDEWSEINPNGLILAKFRGEQGAFISGKFYLPIWNEMYIYDPEENSWSVEKLKHVYYFSEYTFAFNGLLYYIGEWPYGSKERFRSYDPVTKEEKLITTNEHRAWHYVTTLYNGNLYLFGGFKQQGGSSGDYNYYFKKFSVYDIEKETTTEIYPSTSESFYMDGGYLHRAHGTLNEVNGVLYWIGGGSTHDISTNEVYSYTP